MDTPWIGKVNEGVRHEQRGAVGKNKHRIFVESKKRKKKQENIISVIEARVLLSIR